MVASRLSPRSPHTLAEAEFAVNMGKYVQVRSMNL
jgi:hypothetical protein